MLKQAITFDFIMSSILRIFLLLAFLDQGFQFFFFSGRNSAYSLFSQFDALFRGEVRALYNASRYQAADGLWRNRRYDNRFTASVEGGYKPNRNWEFSLRWLYAGGSPYTPLDIGESRRLHRDVYDEDRINQARYPDYHSMNLRFDKRFYFHSSSLVFYLSVWNVYNRKNLAMYFWNDAEQKQDEIYQWLILPIFGFEYEL